MKRKELISKLLVCSLVLSMTAGNVYAEEAASIQTDSYVAEADEAVSYTEEAGPEEIEVETATDENQEAFPAEEGGIEDITETPEENAEESIDLDDTDAEEETSEDIEEETEVEVEEEVTAEAKEATSGYYTYTLSGTNATITAYSGSASTLTIPSKIDGYTVTAIGQAAFKGNTNLTSVVISEGITSIGASAFKDCTYLTTLTLPSTITSIGYRGNETYSSDSYYGAFQGDSRLATVTIKSGSNDAYIGNKTFQGCISLKSISIPGNYHTIYREAFSGCTSMTSLSWASTTAATANQSIQLYAFNGCTDLTTVTLRSVNNIGQGAFKGDESLTQLTLNEGLVSIGTAAFMDCKYLTTVTLPSTLTSFGYKGNETYGSDTYYGVFQGDVRLATVTMKAGKNAAYIGNKTFQGCISLKSISIPGNYHTVYRQAFESCTSLESMSWATTTEVSANQSIQMYAFNDCSSLTTVTLNSVSYIGQGAFKNNSSLNALTLNEGLETIATAAFMDCDALTTVTLPSTLKSIGYGGNETYSSDTYYGAFQDDSRLTTVTFTAGKNAAYIGNKTFMGCISLKSATIPGNYHTIYREAFADCSVLTTLSWATTTEVTANQSIQLYAFRDCPKLATVTLRSVNTIGQGAFKNAGSLTKLTLNEGLVSIGTVAFMDCKTLTSVTLPSTIQAIGYQGNETYGSDTYFGAFQGDDALTTVTIKAGRNGAYIGNKSFMGCISLSSISIPGNYHTVYREAFADCKSLTSLNWDATTEVTPNHIISLYAFRDCSKLASITLNSVKSIGQGAFKYNTSLTGLSLNEGLESIGASAFLGCSSLTTLTLPGTITGIGYGSLDSYSSELYYGAFEDNTKLTKVYIKAGKSKAYTLGNRTFKGCSSLTGIYFYNDAPSFVGNCFSGVTATAYYPTGNTTYTSENKQSYGGTITWKTWTPTESTLAITTQPKTITVADGSTATFTVAATGSGLTYQWQYCNSGSTTWTNSSASSATTKTLKFSAKSSANNRKYRCIVKDSTGKSVTSNAATLKVFYITTQPASKKVTDKTTVTFTIAANGSGMTYQWQYSKDGGTTWLNSGASTATTASLKFQGTLAKSGYKYRCIVKDSGNRTLTSNAATLTVTAASTTFAITTQPANQYAKTGTTVSFKIVATGTGLTYQWQYSLDDGATWKNSGATGATTATVKFSATSSKNGQKYRCIVKDSNGKSLTSSAARLNVFAITSNPVSKTVTAGSYATFTVKAIGTGLTYQWEYSTDMGTNWAVSKASGATTASIKILGTTARNGQLYRCVVTDSKGNVLTSTSGRLGVK